MPDTGASILRPEWATIALDDKPYPILGEVPEQLLGIWHRAATTGDPTENDDDVLSSWVIGPDLTGGAQVMRHRAGATLNRFADAVADTRRSIGVALPPEVVRTKPTAVASTAVCRPIGDVGARMYVAFDSTPYPYDPATEAWGTAQTALQGPPAGKGVAFKGWVYVPLGNTANGYQRVKEGSAGTLAAYENGPTSPSVVTAVSFELWDNRLVALEHDGQISWTTDGTTWTSESGVKLDESRTPKRLVLFQTRSGEERLYVVTNRDVWEYDADVPRLKRTAFVFAPHPDVGEAAAVYKPGEDLWVSAGVEVHRWTTAHVRVPHAGLSRDQGVKAEFRGKVVDMEPDATGSDLWTLVQGNPAATASETWTVDGSGDDPGVFPDGTAFTTLWTHTGAGWHKLWQSGEPTTLATWARVSSPAGTTHYQLYFGVDAYCYVMKLRRETLNAQEEWASGEGRFAESGYFESGRFDGGLEGYRKLAARIVVNPVNASTSETIRVSYRVDNAAAWTSVGTVTSDGSVDFELDPDGDGFAEGVDFGYLEVRVDKARGSDRAQTPVWRSVVVNYLKTPHPTSSFQVQVPLPAWQWNGRTAQEMVEDLKALADAKRFYRLVHEPRDREDRPPLRVKVAGLTLSDASGDGWKGLLTLNLIEVRQREAAA